MSSKNDNLSKKGTKKQKTMSLLPEKYKSLPQMLKDKLILLMENDNKIKKLDLHCNVIRSLGAQALADALKQNNTLAKLNLPCNQIGDDVVQALADALQQNNTLTHLVLRWNNIGYLGAQALAVALQQNNTITHLDLWNNQIGHLGAQALVDVLYHNNTLTKLHLYSSQIGELCRRALSTAGAIQQIRIMIDTAPYSLFPHILEKYQNDPSVVCWVMQNYPSIVSCKK